VTHSRIVTADDQVDLFGIGGVFRCVCLTDTTSRRREQQQQGERTKQPRTTFLKTGSGKSAYFTLCSPNLTCGPESTTNLRMGFELSRRNSRGTLTAASSAKKTPELSPKQDTTVLPTMVSQIGTAGFEPATP
jgi:hypothetical protein